MATIKFKRGITGPTGLTLGEPAWNYVDNKLYVGVTSSAIWVGAQIDTSTSLGTSNIKIPTQGAVKSYVDAAVVGSVSGVSSIIAGTNITISPVGGTGNVTINSTASGSASGVTGLVAGTGIALSGPTGNVTITNTGVQSFNGSTGAVSFNNYVASFNGSTGAVVFNNYVSSFNGLTGAVTGVASINGSTGAITNVARLNEGNTFSVRQIMNAGISAANLTVNSGVTFNNIDLRSTTSTVQGYNTAGYLKLQSVGTVMATPNSPLITLQDADNDIGGTPNITINPSPTLVSQNTITVGNANSATTLNGTLSVGSTSTLTGRSTHTGGITSANLFVSGGVTFNSTSSHTGLATFNGGITSSNLYITGGSTFIGNISAPNIVNSNVAGTGISVSGSTGNVTITNTGVQSFNGSTGAVVFNSYVSSFNGSTGAITGVSSVNGFTGAVSITYSPLVTITSSNSTSTLYPVLSFGSGNTGLYVDNVTTPLSYVPSTGTLTTRTSIASAGTGSVTTSGPSVNTTYTDGTDVAVISQFGFDHNGSVTFNLGSNIGVNAAGNFSISDYAQSSYQLNFPTSAGSSGQVLATNGAYPATLSWTTVSSSSSTGFTYSSSTPSSPTSGYRWLDSNTGKEYVYINDGSSSQWIQPVSSNGLNGMTYDSTIKLYQFGGTGSFEKLGVGLTAPQYTLDVNGTANFRSGISAASANINGTATITGTLNGAGATFTGAVISDGGYRISSSAINAQIGTTYTLLTADNGKIITMNNGSASTVTIPSGLPIGYNTTVIQLGLGQVGFTSSGTTINSSEGKLNIANRYSAANIISYTTNTFILAGGLTA